MSVVIKNFHKVLKEKHGRITPEIVVKIQKSKDFICNASTCDCFFCQRVKECPIRKEQAEVNGNTQNDVLAQVPTCERSNDVVISREDYMASFLYMLLEEQRRYYTHQYITVVL